MTAPLHAHLAGRADTPPRIDIADPDDLSAWAERLDVQADELRDAVLQVGDEAEAVELVLKGSVTVSTSH
ncbi:MAG: DUF3606 domain-containing protein [Rubrivivax sp.]|nr:MAG: DUF3606 domain-containing protein [Rubrivivax sp.]